MDIPKIILTTAREKGVDLIVTEKLREVMARKWIINESPIFVGIYNGDKLVV